MNNLGIDLQSYAESNENFAGFGTANTSEEQLRELNKAIQAGSITGRSTDGQDLTGQPLKVESLERSLKLLEFKDTHIRQWKRIPKMTAYNTVEEYNQLVSYGPDRGGFYQEGELPDNEDSVYRRQSQLIKFLGVTRAVTHQATLTNNVVEVMQQEIKNGTMWILRKVNNSIHKADSDIIPEEFNGLYKQHQQGEQTGDLDTYFEGDNVIDLRGASITQSDINDGAITVLNNFGTGTLFFAPPQVINDLSKDYFQRQRFFFGADGGQGQGYNGTIGVNPQAISTTVGDVALEHDLFMRKEKPVLLTDAATSQKAPNQVTNTSSSVTAGGDPSSKFGSTENGNTVYYAIASLNRYGQSQLQLVSGSAVTLASGESVDISFDDGGGSVPATGYAIYRSKDTSSGSPSADGVQFYKLFEISTSEKSNGYDGAGAGDARDRNRFLPDTDQAYLIQGDEEVFSFKQLAPLMKMDLAVLSPSKRFMILLYGSPFLYASQKMVRYINIGTFS